jgi:hypothetical protein
VTAAEAEAAYDARWHPPGEGEDPRRAMERSRELDDLRSAFAPTAGTLAQRARARRADRNGHV